MKGATESKYFPPKLMKPDLVIDWFYYPLIKLLWRFEVGFIMSTLVTEKVVANWFSSGDIISISTLFFSHVTTVVFHIINYKPWHI